MNPTVSRRPVRVPCKGVVLDGDLDVPRGTGSIVVFAHGSGSGRHSPRNRFVARALQEAGHATLLLDLLTTGEERVDERTRHLRFDIPFLADRLHDAVEWVAADSETSSFRVGLFGASTGAAAALITAVSQARRVGAVVSRGGRPDLAPEALPLVRAPTLLIVGGNDTQVLELNEAAHAQLRCAKELRVIRGATHLFEEPGALETVAAVAGEWFTRHLVQSDAGRSGP